MRNCEEYELWISALLDGELTADEQAELREHMAACRDCRQYFDDLTVIHAALTDGDEVPVPEGFADQVMERVRGTKQNRTVIRFPHWKRWAAMAACCAIVLLGVWGFRERSIGEQAENEAWVTAADAPRTAADADIPAALDDSADEIMPMADGGQARIAEDKYDVENEVADAKPEEAAMGAYCRDSAKNSEEATASPKASAGDASGGTLAAGGDAVRQWVEDRLGMEWVSGQTYELTEEQYHALAEWLTESDTAFRIEPGDGYRLAAE